LPPELVSEEGLRLACQSLGPPAQWGHSGGEWSRLLTETLRWVRSSGQAGRSARDFQERLWEENEVSAIGRGNVPVDRALDDVDFRAWLAARSVEQLPRLPQERLAFLRAFYQDVKERLAPFLGKRVPHLKIFRVMAALFPEAMTTVASAGALKALAQAMGCASGLDTVGQHLWVRQRIDDILGPASDEPAALAERMALPWMLYERFVQHRADETEEPIEGGKDLKLVPLPAARRRRGLTAIRGLFPGVLSTLEYVREGATRAELLDFLRASSPEAKANSLGVTISALQGELAVIRAEGDHYVLTERGADVLESQDPSHLADWILTRILGADRALVELRDRGPVSTTGLTAAVRATNPGLTSDFVPQALLAWLRSMDIIKRATDGNYSLTEQGKDWARRIHWEPEGLPAEPPEVTPPGGDPPVGAPLVRPQLAALIDHIQRLGARGESRPGRAA
jgi:5-methylcytosine-specific restriction enzyme B